MDRTNKGMSKKRGRPATGRDPVVPVRLPAEIIKKIDGWGKTQAKPTDTRSEAIRRLVEIGLANFQATQSARSKSADLAGRTIDRLADPSVSAADRAKRKRRLLKGPREFRDIRDDEPKPVWRRRK